MIRARRCGAEFGQVRLASARLSYEAVEIFIARAAISLAQGYSRRPHVVGIDKTAALADQLEHFFKDKSPALIRGKMMQRPRGDHRIEASLDCISPIRGLKRCLNKLDAAS